MMKSVHEAELRLVGQKQTPDRIGIENGRSQANLFQNHNVERIDRSRGGETQRGTANENRDEDGA